VLSDYHRLLLSDIDKDIVDKSVLIPPPANMRMSEDNEESRIRGRQMLGVSSGDFLIVYLGYVHAGKGLESLLTAFQRVASSRPNARLAIVGGTIDPLSKNAPSYLAEIRAYSKELGIDDDVRWTGSYSWDDERASLYLRAADVCVLPFAKGVHLNNSSFASAISHGLPTITTRPQVADVPIKHAENVLLCSPGKADEIESAIRKLMDSPAHREKLRLGAARLAREWFSWDSAVDRTLETLLVPGPTSP
jgi:glycosyltransferase involved in cell wall biosynthesis